MAAGIKSSSVKEVEKNEKREGSLSALADFHWKNSKPQFIVRTLKLALILRKRHLRVKTRIPGRVDTLIQDVVCCTGSFHKITRGWGVPAVMVSFSLDVFSSIELLLWISKRLAKPSLGFHSDCRRRGFSWSPTTRNPSVLQSRLSMEPMVSQRTYDSASSLLRPYLDQIVDINGNNGNKNIRHWKNTKEQYWDCLWKTI